MVDYSMLPMVSDATARRRFKIYRVGGGYRISCFDCKQDLGLWDYRANALGKAYAHQLLSHNVRSMRTEHYATSRLFKNRGN